MPWIVFLPLIAGAVAFAIPVRAAKLREVFSVVVSAAVFLLGMAVLVGPEASYRAVSLGFVQGYLVDLRIDELNRFMVMFASLFGLLVTVFSIGYMRGRSRLREYYPYVLISIGAANGALLADNWLALVGFWGLILATLFLLTTIGAADADANKVMRAAGKSMIILGAADLALILGVGLVFVQSGTLVLSETSLPVTGSMSVAAFVLIMLGALSKAGAMPMHSWIPDMAEASPTSVVALLPASLDKLLGIYLLARLVLGVFQVNLALNLLLMVIGAVTIVAAVARKGKKYDIKYPESQVSIG